MSDTVEKEVAVSLSSVQAALTEAADMADASMSRQQLVDLWAGLLDERGFGVSSVPDHFPTRVRPVDGDTKLLTLVYNFAKDRDEQPIAVESRQDLAAWAIRYGRQHTDGVGYDTFVLTVLREVYESIAGEELATAANRHLRRFVNLAGPLSALRCMCMALANGAGLDGGFEDDPRSVLKYAVAIYNGERSGQ